MKVKRIICLLIGFLLLFSSFANASDKTEGIRFILSDSKEGISIDLPLIPGYSCTVGSLKSITLQEIISLLKPDTFAKLTDSYKNTVNDMYMEKNGANQKGIYAGDLFDNAAEEQITEAEGKDAGRILNDFIGQYILHVKEVLTDDRDFGNFESFLSQIEGQAFGEETVIQIKTYNRGSYQTINILDHNQCVLTISSDLTEKDGCRFVAGHGAGDADYYEEFIYRQNGNDAEYEISLFRTSSPAFSMVEKRECVLSARLLCQNIHDGQIKFDGEASTVLIPSRLRIQGYGSIDDEGQASVSGNLFFDEQAEGSADLFLTILNTLFQQ